MKTILTILSLITSITLVSAENPDKPTYSRGWIGGQYKLAKQLKWVWHRNTVHGFPDELLKQQKAGIFVSAIYSNTPAFNAGLRAGDLVLSANGTTTDNINRFCKSIDKTHPGNVLLLSVYRDGETLDIEVIAGRETYQKNGSFQLGFMPSRFVDLVPNPDFSLLALGFNKTRSRTELHVPESNSAEAEFLRKMHPTTEVHKETIRKDGVTSSEGWHAWCLLFAVSRNHQILSQEIVTNP